MIFDPFPASLRGPARGNVGEVGWLSALAKILPFQASGGPFPCLPLHPQSTLSPTHVHSHPHPSPTFSGLLSTCHKTTAQLPAPPESLRPSAS